MEDDFGDALLAKLVDPRVDLIGGARDRGGREQRAAGHLPRRSVCVVEMDAVTDVDVQVTFVLAPPVDRSEPLLAARQ